MPDTAEGLILDRGYSWVVFVASFFNQFITLGVPFSFAVYNVEFLDYFGQSKAVTAWICSINIGVLLGCGPIASWMMSKFSERVVACAGAILSTIGTVSMFFSTSVYHLYITYGLITGFGYCMVYVPSAVLVGHYFKKYRSATTGICSVGGSLAILVLPFLYTYTIDKYTWKGSMFVLSSLNLQMLVFSALLRPQNPAPVTPDAHESPKSVPSELHVRETSREIANAKVATPANREDDVEDETEEFDIVEVPVTRALQVEPQIMKRKMTHSLKGDHVMLDFAFLIYFVSNIFWNIGTGILVIVPVDYLYENGTDKETASMVVVFCGGGGLFGGAAAGILGNHRRCNRLFLYIGVNIAAGVAGILYLVSTNFVYILICAAVFGFAMGAIVSLLVVLCADIIGIDKLGQAFGYLMFSNGVGNLAGPPLAGLLFDTSGNYRSSLILAGVLNILGGVVMFLIPLQSRMKLLKTLKTTPRPAVNLNGPEILGEGEELSPLSTFPSAGLT